MFLVSQLAKKFQGDELGSVSAVPHSIAGLAEVRRAETRSEIIRAFFVQNRFELRSVIATKLDISKIYKIVTDDNLASKHKYYSNQFFGKWAWFYDFEKYFTSPLRIKAARFLNAEPKSKVLDVATGTGALAYELAKLGLDVTGIDLSPEMLEQAKKKCSDLLKLQFLHADATEIPFEDNYFDCSSISWGLHDMPRDIGILVLKEMKRVTKKDGGILIVDYMEPKKHPVAKISHILVGLYETKNYKPFIEHGLRSILSEVGLEIHKESNFLGLLQIVLVNNKK